MKMAKILIVFVLVLLDYGACRPNQRVKRVSDQRLAELNTKLGLSQLKGQIVTIPVAHGKLDPAIISDQEKFTTINSLIPT
ncbi:uncharacterized protein [Onthophagus taurus]|uniref:uncharacterized protein isoform X2 n=1 Tax=Onthophagus taurus TaxID=166361 RepID=UPI0039BDAC64